MFKMTVTDTFSLTGLGMAGVGCVESGTVTVDDEIELSSGRKTRTVRVLRIDKFGATVTYASVGPEEIAVCINVQRGEIKKGDILTGP